MRSPFARLYKMYAQNHRTTGCRITHLIGVPTVATGLAMMLFSNRLVAGCLLGIGYALQVAGHVIFEKNEPVLLKTKDLRVIPVAIIFVARDWQRVFTGRFTSRDLRKRRESGTAAEYRVRS